MNSHESSPYDAAIADVEARIQQLQGALEVLLQLRAQSNGSAAPLPSMQRATNSESDIQHDTFFGLAIGDAARKFLAIVKTTKSTAEVCAALERGGLKHSSKDFQATVRSIIGQRDEFVRVPNGDWGLTEWYPGMRKDKKKPKGKGGAVAIAPSSAAASAPPGFKLGQSKGNTPGVLNLLQGAPSSAFTVEQIGESIGLPENKINSLRSLLSSLVKQGRIMKADKGYRARVQ